MKGVKISEEGGEGEGEVGVGVELEVEAGDFDVYIFFLSCENLGL